MEATTPHAVRWITGKRFNLRQYTKWHFTDNADFTGCRRPIRLMDEFDHKLPDTDDDLSRVNCKLCRRRAGDTKGSGAAEGAYIMEGIGNDYLQKMES